MDPNAYIIRRIGTAKVVGIVIGLAGFFMTPAIAPDEGQLFRLGVLAWYGTFGAMIGLMGLFNHHPMLKLPLPWWFRGTVFGAWFNLVIVLLLHDKLVAVIGQMMGLPAWLANPFWLVAEGAVIGVVVDGIATKVAGDGLPAETGGTR
jgi:hypothetical protein